VWSLAPFCYILNHMYCLNCKIYVNLKRKHSAFDLPQELDCNKNTFKVACCSTIVVYVKCRGLHMACHMPGYNLVQHYKTFSTALTNYALRFRHSSFHLSSQIFFFIAFLYFVFSLILCYSLAPLSCLVLSVASIPSLNMYPFYSLLSRLA
jgi:hypothetical protein